MDRRRMLGWACAAIGAALGVALGGPAAAYLTFPTRKRTVSGADNAIDAGEVAKLPEGKPVRVTIRVPRWRDAWVALTDVTLGAVWLRRDAGQVRALSTVCPHAGCAVDWIDGARRFECPCHDSVFDEHGARISGPAPRGMDALDCAVENGHVMVTWRRFRPGVPDKEPT